MTQSPQAFAAYVKDQLGPLPGLATSRFFGGTGLAAEGTQFAMVMEGALYFVVDDATRPRYLEMGSRCFAYGTRKGTVEVHRYYEVPGDLVDDAERLLELAGEALAAARRTPKGRRRARG